jgi:hypothetical protein
MNKIFRIIIGMAVAFGLLVGNSTVAFAQATRTWVSGVGDDANPCSRTAPCKTFAGAISKTAAGGEINVLDAGGFGAVTITKAMTIDGGGSFASILSSGTNGIVINAGVNDRVILKNLSIQGAGTGLNGIRFLAGASLSLQNVQIRNVTQQGIDFEPSGASRLFATDVVVENIGSNGVLIMPGAAGSATVVLNQVQTYGSVNGVQAQSRSTVIILNSTTISNTNNGFVVIAAAQASTMLIEGSLTSGSKSSTGGGVKADGALATILISNITTTNNGNGLFRASGGQIISFGNNKNAGNTTNGTPSSTVALQ